MFSRVCRADTNCTRVFWRGVRGAPASCRAPNRCSLPNTEPEFLPPPNVDPGGDLTPLLLLTSGGAVTRGLGGSRGGDDGMTSTPLRFMAESQDSRWPRCGVPTLGRRLLSLLRSRGECGGANE